MEAYLSMRYDSVGMILESLLGKTENFSDPKTKTRVLAVEPAHSYKIFLK